MERFSTYLLILLLTVSMGGAFHHHDENIHPGHNIGTLYIYDHNCNDHKNHPDIAHNYHCIHCSRVVTSTVFEDILSEFGGVEIIDIFPATNNSPVSNLDHLRISEPRSPPQSA